MAEPADPVKFLGEWIHHYLNDQERLIKRREEQAVVEKQREAWNKSRGHKQGEAANAIQREWKAHTKAQLERQHKENALLLEIQEAERDIEENHEDLKEENMALEEFEGQTEKEKDLQADTIRADMAYKKTLLVMQKLDKAAIGALKTMKKPTNEVVLVVKCCFYMLNKQPADVLTWQHIRMLLKPALFLKNIKDFDPTAPNTHKKRKFVRVRRVLKAVNEETLKKSSVAGWLLHQWLQNAVELRKARDEEIAVKREYGREVEEEEEEEENPEEEDAEGVVKDPDEERERLIEEAEERERKEAEAKLRAEMEDGGEENDEDDAEG
eukprot:TRINITY_DN66313_c7_g5_i1.p2 TRINITY_DN66313_c7_g5~~TRINITY_DN66313_c7_g5_i1.p2  ORF type:complete len:354 (-),score=69.51 TRINITY_DN66313_c7_g5_i1:1276-2250(-)